MKPILLNEAPPPAKRPKCQQCARSLAPHWRLAKSDLIYNAQGFSSQETLEWRGEYRSYGAFCTLRCAAKFANAAHEAGYRRKA